MVRGGGGLSLPKGRSAGAEDLERREHEPADVRRSPFDADSPASRLKKTSAGDVFRSVRPLLDFIQSGEVLGSLLYLVVGRQLMFLNRLQRL